MNWKRILAYISGSVDEELQLRNEYLATENKILRNQVKGRLKLTDSERISLAEIGKKLGRKALEEVASIVKPDTILAWHRRLIAKKFDGSKNRKCPGRPRVDQEIEELVIALAKDNRSWGYDRIAGVLKHLDIEISDQTVGNILKRNGISPAPERKKGTTWKEFIRAHMDILSSTDFFTTEVWTKSGLVTYYVLFFIRLGSRKIQVAGITPHPYEAWMVQLARTVTWVDVGFLKDAKYLIHDRDSKFSKAFRETMKGGGVECLNLPAQSPNLNAFAERWVRTIKEECLSNIILFGEDSLRRVLKEFETHYNHERPHQGVGNVILFPRDDGGGGGPPIQCRERLGGLLRYYYKRAG